MIVIDASAFLELLLRTPVGKQVEDHIAEESVAAPHLLDAEVLHRLVTFGKRGVMRLHEVNTAVDDLKDAPIVRCDHRPLLTTAQRFSATMSGYDALYAALAWTLDAPLLTGDTRLAATAVSQFDLPFLPPKLGPGPQLRGRERGGG